MVTHHTAPEEDPAPCADHQCWHSAQVVATRHRDGPRRNSPSIIEALHRDDRIGPAECEGIANSGPDPTGPRTTRYYVEIAFGIEFASAKVTIRPRPSSHSAWRDARNPSARVSTDATVKPGCAPWRASSR